MQMISSYNETNLQTELFCQLLVSNDTVHQDKTISWS